MVVEKIYPFAYPNFEKIILLDEYKVKKSKLYYIRDKVGKAARMKSLISSERRGMNLLTETKQVVLSPIVSAA
ncbi:50S ribosomal protein L19 [bacterium]|nr:50S ribosomal protein L19 [bacterium]